MDRRRCIIPPDGFYEWRKQGSAQGPNVGTSQEQGAFAFAGLWVLWRKPDGKRLESFTIITTEPNELIEPIHNRIAYSAPGPARQLPKPFLSNESLKNISGG